MGKYIAGLALIAGVGLAVTMHGTRRADPPQPGPDLPGLAQIAAPASPIINTAWPGREELSGLAAGCGGCLPANFQASLPWQVPDLAGGPASPGLRIGLEQPPALDRLRAAPLDLAANPLLMPGDASLNDLPRLELAPAPEPQSWAMLITGLALVGARMRRRQSRCSAGYLATL